MKLLILSIFLLMFLHISCESEKLESENLEEDSIKSEAHFVNDLGADSLDTVELIMEFEE